MPSHLSNGLWSIADLIQMMVRETCYFASDYDEELRQLGTPTALAANTAVVQFPYTEAVR